MQQRLQQAAINDRERRTLLAQLESREEAQKVLVSGLLLTWAMFCIMCLQRDTFVTHSARDGRTTRRTAQVYIYICFVSCTVLKIFHYFL